MHRDSGALSTPDAASRAAAAGVAAEVAAEAGVGGDVGRAQRLGALAARASVDRFSLERWVGRETWLGAHTAAESIERDVGLARVLHAWERRDAQELLDALEGVTRRADGVLDDLSWDHRRAAYDIGSNTMVSSLFDAVTDKRIHGGQGTPEPITTLARTVRVRRRCSPISCPLPVAGRSADSFLNGLCRGCMECSGSAWRRRDGRDRCTDRGADAARREFEAMFGEDIPYMMLPSDADAQIRIASECLELRSMTPIMRLLPPGAYT